MRNKLRQLSLIIRWSVLAKVGSTSAMRLTVLIPLIGFFLLFNTYTETLLSWPKFIRDDLGIEQGSGFSPRNLYYTYFGLCLLGIGSFLFSIYCPREIAGEPNIDRYVINAPSTNAPIMAKDDFRTVLSIRFGEGRMLPDGEDEETLNFPTELFSDFHGLMEELYSGVDYSGDDDAPEVMMMSGYLNFTELARAVWGNIRAHWVFTQPFYDISPKYAHDIAFVKYRFLDYSRFNSRVSIAILYLLGFALLLKPTIHATILLITAWLSAN